MSYQINALKGFYQMAGLNSGHLVAMITTDFFKHTKENKVKLITTKC